MVADDKNSKPPPNKDAHSRKEISSKYVVRFDEVANAEKKVNAGNELEKSRKGAQLVIPEMADKKPTKSSSKARKLSNVKSKVTSSTDSTRTKDLEKGALAGGNGIFDTVKRMCTKKILIAAIVLLFVVGFIVGIVLIAKLTCTADTVWASEHPTTPNYTNETEKPDSPSAHGVNNGLGYRLPKNVLPQYYDLQLKVYVPGFGSNFPAAWNWLVKGNVRININVKEKVDFIQLNYIYQDIAIKEAYLYLVLTGLNPRQSQEDNSWMWGRMHVSYNKTLERGIFRLLDRAIPPGKYAMLIRYLLIVPESLSGLYQSTYLTDDGEKRSIATTHMEPTDARRMVPCFDEPEFKAPWLLTVHHPVGTIATSNGALVQKPIEEMDEYKTPWLLSKFKETPKMSSYLLALVIHDFDQVNATTKNGVQFTIWARKDKKALLSYALKFGIKCIEYYEDLFGIPFPLKKIDMMAIPDFSAGAMENWGLITYRERVLLLDEENGSYDLRRRVSEVIAHELAHQWFGNLVTMSWWDDLWLNEGFADYIAFVAVEALESNLHAIEYFVRDEQGEALNLDVMASVEPIHFKAETSEDARDGFSSITYSKGGSILHMLRNMIGHDNFIQGLRNYLKDYAYKNAETKNLWEYLEKASKKNADLQKALAGRSLVEVADGWTDKMGYPMIDVKQGKNPNEYVLTQQRYYLGNPAKMNKKYEDSLDFQWTVPLFIKTKNGSELQQKLYILHAGSPSSPKPLTIYSESLPIVNHGAQSFVRVNYRENWKDIRNHFSITVDEPSGQIRHYDDVFYAAKAGLVHYSEALSFVKNFRDYSSPIAKTVLIDNLFDVWARVNKTKRASATKVLRHHLGQKYLNKLNFQKVLMKLADEDKTLDQQTVNSQTEIKFLRAECRLWPEKCQPKLQDAFNVMTLNECQMKNSTEKPKTSKCSKIPQVFRKWIYCEAVRSEGNNRTIFDTVKKFYKNENDQIESNDLLMALTCTKNWDLIEELLIDIIKKVKDVKQQDVTFITRPLSGSDDHAEKLLDFLEKHYKDAEKNLENKELGELIKAGISQISTEKDYARAQAIRESATRLQKSAIWDKAFESYEIREKWTKEHEKEVVLWFDRHAKQLDNLMPKWTTTTSRSDWTFP
ncbi:unnamed protein product, partial [Mesorhabditis belari]|uniref:Aminopeptidase n=1 Tax=Mesorhabditis belari TaxID=2138241 RepID=A0AAF3F5A3_9BILA